MQEIQQLLADWQPLVRISVIVVSAVLLRLLIRLATKRVVRTVSKGVRSVLLKSAGDQRVAEARVLQRTRTIAAVIDRSASWGIGITAAVMSLAELGIDIGALIAVTTVIGAAIGFGAQSAVKDFIAGVFIIFEDQYGVGDWVDLDGVSGEVERMGLRTTQLRDSQGTLWFIRNGEILRVGNSSQEWAKSLVEIGFGATTKVEAAENLLRKVADRLKADSELSPLVIGDLEIMGVEQLTSDRYLVRVALKTLPKKQWQIGNEFRRQLLLEAQFDGVTVLDASRPPRGLQ